MWHQKRERAEHPLGWAGCPPSLPLLGEQRGHGRHQHTLWTAPFNGMFPHGDGPQRAEATEPNVLACIQTLPHRVTGGPLFSGGLGMTALFQYGALFK